MTDQFLGEIRILPFNFAPTGWATCNGQILPIAQNAALFSLLGTTYGGDGVSTYALPNLQDSVPLHFGQGPGLSLYVEGESGGSSAVTLLAGQLPSHSHGLQGFKGRGGSSPTSTPAAGDTLAPSNGGLVYSDTPTALTSMGPNALAQGGGGQPHNNMMPSLTLNFCIALTGIYPQHN